MDELVHPLAGALRQIREFTARFFMARLLPWINAVQAAVDAGSKSLA